MKHFVKGRSGTIYDLTQFRWAKQNGDKVTAGRYANHPYMAENLQFSARDWKAALEQAAPRDPCHCRHVRSPASRHFRE